MTAEVYLGWGTWRYNRESQLRIVNPIAWLLFALLLAGLGLSPSRNSILPYEAFLPAVLRESASTSGTIEGRVFFKGETIPDATVIENLTDPQSCGIRHSFEDLLISRQNRGIQNVILALANEDFPPKPSPKGEKLILDNRKCRFEPHVAVLTTGSTVEAVNSDPIFHTTHLYYGSLSRNLSLHVGGKASQPINRSGFVIVKCDIHGWMKAFIRVDNHPFHAVSDTNGRFQIRGIPEGSYTLEVWHEYFGEQKLAVTVKDGKTVTLEIEYQN